MKTIYERIDQPKTIIGCPVKTTVSIDDNNEFILLRWAEQLPDHGEFKNREGLRTAISFPLDTWKEIVNATKNI